MSAQVNYYDVLGVNENASADDIKRAYRVLAKKYHPDSSGGDSAASDKFKEISEAYAVLGDEQKRRQYDALRQGGFGSFNFGGAGSQQVHFGGDTFFDNLGDIFGNLFGNANGGRSGGQTFRSQPNFDEYFQQGRRGPSRGPDMETTVTIPFELAVNGGETVIKTGNGKRVKIKIPAGLEEGKKIKIRGQGAVAPPGGQPGDLFVSIKIAPHLEFERQGRDIHSTTYLNIAEALLGTEVLVKTVGGKQVKLKIPAGTSSAKVFRLPGLGIKSPNGSGDHFVRVEIDMPQSLSMSQKREFKNWAKKTGLIKG